MNLYTVRVTVIVRLQGAHSPRDAEAAAWQTVARLISTEPLAGVTAALATPDREGR